MNGDTRPERTALPLDVLNQIDGVCDRFEAAWESGDRPRVEDYLGAVAEPYRTALLRDLLAAELNARRQHGEQPEAREYLDRFPGEAALVEVAFASTPIPISRLRSRIRRSVQMKKCLSCKSEVPEGSHFCPKCG